MTFKEVRKAITNGSWKEMNRVALEEAVSRQEMNLSQQREGLLRCVFGSKRAMSGRVAKVTSSDYDAGKSSPFYGYLETDRLLNKFKTVSDLHEQLLTVQKKLGLVK